jgi:hypothetical protein
MPGEAGVVVMPQRALAAVTERFEQLAAEEAALHERIAAGPLPSLLERDAALQEQITWLD